MNEYDELLTAGKGAKPRNEYDAVLQEQNGAQQTLLRATMQTASQVTPDRAAQVIKLSERTKLPTNVVERNFDDLSKKYDLSDNEYDTMLRQNPKLSQWLLDTSNAAIARDDLPLMQRIENTFASFGRGWSKASMQGELADILYKEMESGLSPVEKARRDKLKGDMLYLSRQDAQNGVPEYVSGVTGYSARQMGSTLYEGAEGAGYGGVAGAAAGSVLPGVGTVAGGTAGMIAGATTKLSMYAYRMESAFAYDELRDMVDINENKIDPKIARNVARGVGVVNALIEAGSDVALASLVPGFGSMISGLSKQEAKNAVRRQALEALKVPTTRAALASAVGKMGAAGSVEGAEEFLQSLVGAGGREIAQGASGQAFKPDDITDDIRKASGEAIDAAVGTFFTFAPVGGARFYQLHRQAQKAQEQEQFFLALGEGVSASKVYERLPPKMQDFIAHTTQDGPVDKVYVPVEQWSTYWQNKGVDPAAAAEAVVGNTTMYEAAIQSGSDLVIPMDKFATRIAPTEHGAFFASEARLAPDEMNAREAKELEATLAKEQAKADAETQKVEQAKQAAGDVDAVMTKLREDIKQKLIAAGVEQRTADDYAAAQEARFRQFADRAGISAEALFERFVKGDKLTVGTGEAAQGGGQQMMSQGAKDKLPLAQVGNFATGKPVAFDFIRNTQKAPKPGADDQFAQNVEPAGRYMQEKPGTYKPMANMEDGSISFSNPLVIDFGEGLYSDQTNWKRQLSAAYGGLTGEKLSRAIAADGHDGIVTIGKHKSGETYTSEMVDLSMFKPVIGDTINVDGQDRVLKDYGFSEINDETRQKIYEFVTRLRNMPTEYFEGKITREVDLAEFKAAVVPEDVNPKVIEALRSRGVTIETYKKEGDPAKPNSTRKLAVKHLADRLGDTALFQPPEQDAKRGSITFTPPGADRRFKIDLLEGADLSTFVHESGHFWLEVMGDLVQELRVGDASKLNDKQRKMIEDYDALLKWMGAKSRADIGVEEHEKFARGIEAYFMEGKAPSPALQNLFARVRSWMVAIYQSLTKLNVALTPEVRDVFDRMLASDQEIEAAQAEAGIEPLFADDKTLIEAGFTPEFVAAYRDKVQAASDSAKRELTEKVMRAITREREAWWKEERAKVRADVAEEVNARQEQVALSILTRDVMPNGDPLPYDVQRIKMNRAEIDAMYGEGAWKTLPRGSTATDGLPLQAVADLLGYSSGDALVKAVRQAKPAAAVIEAETDSRMKQEHGDMLVDGTIHAAAQDAVMNEQRGAVIHAELRALARLAAAAKPAVDLEKRQQAEQRREGIARLETQGKSSKVGLIPPLAELRRMASRVIASRKVSDLNPMSYLVAARRASMGAVEAAGEGDFTTAISMKKRELLNVELFKAARAAREEVEKTVDYMQSFGESKKRARIAKAGQDYLDQIDGFLDRYDFAKVSQKALERRKSLAAWVAQKEAAGEQVNLPDDVVVETRTNYKDMTVEELRGVRDSVKHIEHMAKLKNRLLTAQKNRDLAEVVDEIETSIRGNATKVKGKQIESRLPTDEALRFVDTWFGMHRKLANMLRQMDGWKDGGALWEYVMRPINEAANREAAMNADSTKKLQKLFELYAGKEGADLYVKRVVPEIGGSLTKMARLMVALNWGNNDNRQKIMDGYGWTTVQIESILNTLDARDWKFVQGVWDFIDSYWTEIEAKEKRVNGIAPAKVERSPVMTKFGEFAGGYFPLRYDDRQDAAAHGDRIKEAAEQMMRGGYTSQTTRRGHTKERVEGVNRPIRLDFGVIFEHVTQVTHDLSHHEMLIDVTRILRSKPVSGSVIEVYGDVTYKQIQNTLTDIAAGDIPAVGAFEKSINYLRQGATIAGLGWNLMTSLLQPLGLAQSMVRIGPMHVGQGMRRWLSSGAGMEGSAAWIQDRSTFMANRFRTQQREINEIRNQVGVNSGKLSGWIDQAMRTTTFNTVTKQGVVDSYFWLIAKAQQIADIPTWLGAYEKAMANGDALNDDGTINEQRAVDLADQAVLDSQGGGQIKDMAAIQRGGPLLKIWTSFYSYFNVTYNMSRESIGRTKFSNPISVGRLAVDFALLYIVPATMGALMKSALKGDADDPDKLVEKLIRENLSYLFGTMVGLREIGSVIQGYSGYEGPAGARFFSTIGKLVKQSEQGEADGAFWKALNDAAGILFHYPAGQVRRAVEGGFALSEGDTKNPAAVLFGAPKQ